MRATDRGALLQYWRETSIVRLNDMLTQVRCPVLDLHTLPRLPAEDAGRANKRLADLETLGVAGRVTTVFWFRTGHFVHELRPADVDAAVADFLAGRPVRDELPARLRRR